MLMIHQIHKNMWTKEYTYPEAMIFHEAVLMVAHQLKRESIKKNIIKWKNLGQVIQSDFFGMVICDLLRG